MTKIVTAAFVVLLSCGSALAQVVGVGNYPFATFDNHGFDSINLGNNNIRFKIPIVIIPGRGLGFNYSIQYDGLIWSPENIGGTWVWSPSPTWGFTGLVNSSSYTGYVTSQIHLSACQDSNGRMYDTSYRSDFIYYDSNGAGHPLNYQVGVACDGTTYYTGGSATDGSGFAVSNVGVWNDTLILRTREGQIVIPESSSIGSDPTQVTDPNGNFISFDGHGSFTDTRGVLALTISGVNPITYTYPVALQANRATTATVVASFKSYIVRTNFQVSGIAEYGSNPVSLVDRITLADGSYYAFGYEGTPGAADGAVTGRLAAITLPTGATIQYIYHSGSPGGINTDGTPAGLTRTTFDGTKEYDRNISGYPNTTEYVRDEKGNDTTLSFEPGGYGEYETNRSIYQGPDNSGLPPLESITTVYNGYPSQNGYLESPFNEVDVTTTYNNISQKLVKTSYDSSENRLRVAQWTGPNVGILQTTAYTYNSLNEPTSVVVTDNSGTTTYSETDNYDEGSVTSSTGIPQHIAVSGPRGNKTSVHISTGTSTLTTTAAYWDTGMPVWTTAPSQDPLAGPKTSYSYDATQTFVTNTFLPTPPSGVALSTGASYDSYSGGLLTVTGMNSEQTIINQYDPLMRPTQTTTPPLIP